MKKLFTILTVLLTITQVFAQSKEDAARIAKNKIKSATQSKYEYLYGKLQPQGKKVQTVKYDKKGNMIEQVDYNERGTIENKQTMKYDSKGTVIELIVYNTDGTVAYKVIQKPTYDSTGTNLIQTEVYRQDSSYAGKSVYVYDAKGNMIEDGIFDDKALLQRNTHEYNDKGLEIKTVNYQYSDSYLGGFTYKHNEQGQTIETTLIGSNGLPEYVETYKYDVKGNVTEITRYNSANKPIAVYKYTYEYYQ